MDCNKPEAMRAKEMAEKKMQSSDFVGARRLGQRAQQLFPEVENISQLLAVCDVHCAAQNKVNGSELDWYGILQVEQMADDIVIKKQYRKLALLLHPDKNKLAGAEAAFKLVGQANTVLSDQGKRSYYNMKLKLSMRTTAPKAPPHQANKNANASKQFVVPDVAKSCSKGSNMHTQGSEYVDGKEVFWTCCPFCMTRYQYFRDVINRRIRCQRCSKYFIAYDLGVLGVPHAADRIWPDISHQRQVPTQSVFGSKTVGSESVPKRGSTVDVASGCSGEGRNEPVNQGGFSKKTAGSESVTKTGTVGVGSGCNGEGCNGEGRNEPVNQGGFSKKTAGSESVGKTSTVGVDSGCNSELKNGEHVNFKDLKEGDRVPKADAETNVQSRRSRHLNKRRQKMVVESSESHDTASTDGSEEDSATREAGGEPDSKSNGVHPRRSSRRKRHISYNESDDEDSFACPSKVPKVVESPRGRGVNGSSNSFGFSSVADGFKDEVKENGGPPFVQNSEATNSSSEDVEAEDENDGDPLLNQDYVEESEEYVCPDPEFNDFDEDKADNCLAVGQIWAIYDNADGMPRYYGRVRKIFSGEFHLRVTWLEPDPNEDDEIEWVGEDLPVACGRYKHGGIDHINQRASLSHQMKLVKGTGKGSFIYPREGEIWAVYKDWYMEWKSEPESHRKYEYEVVEVMEDFTEVFGALVGYMKKIEGFVSLFKRTTIDGVVAFRISPNQRFRFSHRIPSFRLTGTERVGIPNGAFELDPAALPSNLTEADYAKELKMGSKGTKHDDGHSEFPKNDAKTRIYPEVISTPDKGLDIQENSHEGKVKVRRSPRSLNDSTPKKMDSR